MEGRQQQERLAVYARQISQLYCTSPVRKSWSGSLSRYRRHSRDAAFLVEDGKQMTYSWKGFRASEWENVLIRHQIETVLVGRAKSCKCFSNLCGSWYFFLSQLHTSTDDHTEPWPSGNNPNLKPLLSCVLGIPRIWSRSGVSPSKSLASLVPAVSAYSEPCWITLFTGSASHGVKRV